MHINFHTVYNICGDFVDDLTHPLSRSPLQPVTTPFLYATARPFYAYIYRKVGILCERAYVELCWKSECVFVYWKLIVFNINCAHFIHLFSQLCGRDVCVWLRSCGLTYNTCHSTGVFPPSGFDWRIRNFAVVRELFSEADNCTLLHIYSITQFLVIMFTFKHHDVMLR